MVEETDKIKGKGKQIVKLRQDLDCKDYGIYAAKCVMCEKLYVGQTVTSFNKRWNQHRKLWKETREKRTKMENIEEDTKSDENALHNHYFINHQEYIKKELSECFKIIFLEKPRKEQLDVCEDFWIGKLGASINVNKTFLPTIK